MDKQQIEIANRYLVEEEKINNPEYKVWNVVNNKIVTGWEYSSDAKDDKKEMEENDYKVKSYNKGQLKTIGLDPDNNKSWGRPTKEESTDESIEEDIGIKSNIGNEKFILGKLNIEDLNIIRQKTGQTTEDIIKLALTEYRKSLGLGRGSNFRGEKEGRRRTDQNVHPEAR